MAKKLISSDIIDDNILKNITTDAEKLLAVTKELKNEFKEVGKTLSKDIQSNKLATSDDVKRLEKQSEQVENLTKNIKELEKSEKVLEKQRLEEIKIQQAREKSVDKFIKQEEKAIKAAQKETTVQAQLLKLKKQLANLQPGTAEFDKVAQQAGRLKDQIDDSREAIAVFSKESKASQAKTLFGQISGDIADLDFAGAADKARQFAAIMKSITFAEIIGGLKQFGSALLDVGKALVKNPIFLLLGAIVAVGVAIKNTVDSVDEGTASLKKLDKEIENVTKSTRALQKVNSDLQIDIDLSLGRITERQAAAAKANNQFKEDELQLLEERKAAIEQFLEERKDIGGGLLNFSDDELAGQQTAGLLKINEAFLKKREELNNKFNLERSKTNIEFDQEEAKRRKERADRIAQIERDIQLALLQDRVTDTQIVVDEIEKKYADSTKDILDGQVLFNGKLKANRETQAALENANLLKLFEDRRILLEEQAKNEKLKVQETVKDKKVQAEEIKKIENQLQIDLGNLSIDAAAKEKALNEQKAKDNVAIAQKEKKEIFDIVSQTSSQIFTEINKRKDAQISALDEEVSTRENNINRQQALAEKGLNNTLEFEKQKQDEAKLERRKLAEEQEKRQKRQVFYQSLIASLESSKTNGEAIAALGKAVAITAAAQGIAGFFKDGVEGFKGKGTGTSDSNIVAISHGESVVTAKGTKNYEGLATAMNNGDVDKWVMSNYNSNSGNKANPQVLMALNKVEQAIKNQPSLDINWDSHDNRVERIVKMGVTKTIKHVNNRPRI